MADPVTPLEALLDDLSRAARCGDLAALSEGLPQLEAARGRLAGVTDPKALTRLRAKAQRLTPCLAAAAAGIRAAQQRLGDIRNARTGLSVYTRDGRMTLPATGGTQGTRF